MSAILTTTAAAAVLTTQIDRREIVGRVEDVHGYGWARQRSVRTAVLRRMRILITVFAICSAFAAV